MPEDAGQLWEGVRGLLDAAHQDPDKALHLLENDAPFTALPREDRQSLIRDLVEILTPIGNSTDPAEGLAVLPAMSKTLAPWAWTAEIWDTNPECNRLVAPLIGDGPVLEAPGRGASGDDDTRSTTAKWSVRAVDGFASEQWHEVGKKLPRALVAIYSQFISGEFESLRVQQLPLRGQLASTSIAGQNLEHRLARLATPIRHGKRTSKDPAGFVTVPAGGTARIVLQGEACVSYAIDRRHRRIWITGVILLMFPPSEP